MDANQMKKAKEFIEAKKNGNGINGKKNTCTKSSIKTNSKPANFGRQKGGHTKNG